ncbi:hypothetical protein D915_008279, partial [Fasciola hepatica]
DQQQHVGEPGSGAFSTSSHFGPPTCGSSIGLPKYQLLYRRGPSLSPCGSDVTANVYGVATGGYPPNMYTQRPTDSRSGPPVVCFSLKYERGEQATQYTSHKAVSEQKQKQKSKATFAHTFQILIAAAAALNLGSGLCDTCISGPGTRNTSTSENVPAAPPPSALQFNQSLLPTHLHAYSAPSFLPPTASSVKSPLPRVPTGNPLTLQAPDRRSQSTGLPRASNCGVGPGPPPVSSPLFILHRGLRKSILQPPGFLPPTAPAQRPQVSNPVTNSFFSSGLASYAEVVGGKLTKERLPPPLTHPPFDPAIAAALEFAAAQLPQGVAAGLGFRQPSTSNPQLQQPGYNLPITPGSNAG